MRTIQDWLAWHPKTTKALTDIGTPVLSALLGALAVFTIPADANLLTVAGLVVTAKALALAVGIPVINALLNAGRRVIAAQGKDVATELFDDLPYSVREDIAELVRIAAVAQDLEPALMEQVNAYVTAEIAKLTAKLATT